MKGAEFLDKQKLRLSEQVDRVKKVTEGLSDAELSKQPEPGVLGVGQVLEHLNLSTEPYLRVMGAAISRGVDDTGGEVRGTFFGKAVAKAAGPDGNAPMPGSMKPGTTQTRAVVDQWLDLQVRLDQLIDQAQGKDLVENTFKNPFVGLLKFNLYDGFNIMIEHNERHIRQIEERVGKVRA